MRFFVFIFDDRHYVFCSRGRCRARDGEWNVSNKTLYIAMNYQAERAKLNSDMTDGIVERLISLENEMNRLRYYVSLLEPRFESIIRLYYFERSLRDEIADMLSCSVRTAQAFRKQAVEKIIETYRFVQGEL